ncbi:MAG: O-acetyl-ADP-ribose deacetylase [Xanthomonadales bacterium]|nr:O-acetyl-ADP-ribose deacetylase [Xanthomonadales bacterium]ODU94334.1 MAG: O-acetyl-ADP-ribose deacetylase [Rhodanobacter sp. SCN 66-43]OJY86941.1 MAG: O-acetyl-ADP-ribose deacetylase [Xanthomonadales bacterium 66-474]
MTIEIIQADITALQVDAIVNAANETLLGGGGVDGAIHRASGPRLLETCRALPETSPGVRCPTGEARITPGFDLPARCVIHTVGPVWRGGAHDEPGLLAACHRGALALAREHAIDSIAFPAISCGVYGYPRDAAAGVALATLAEEQHRLHTPHRIVLCAFDGGMAAAWRAAAERLHVAIAAG